MCKRCLILISLLFSVAIAFSQPDRDTVPSPPVDTSLLGEDIDYDELLDDLGAFLDSLLAPRSYLLANLSINKGYFNYGNNGSTRIDVVEKKILSPNIGYFSKSGLGMTASANVISEDRRLNLYQFSVTPSFDYIKDRRLATGISFSRFFTKDSLRFYASPLQNELNGYFLWRKSWVQPGLNFNYGWGSRTDYEKRKIYYQKLVANTIRRRLLRNLLDSVTIITRNTQSISDFTATASLRHDFYWLDVFSGKDYFRLTPIITMTAGTQRFGLNQASGAFAGTTRTTIALNTRTRDISLREEFKVLSMSLYLRSEYAIGKFFIQPQLLFDYYFPSADDNFNTWFSLNAGFMF